MNHQERYEQEQRGDIDRVNKHNQEVIQRAAGWQLEGAYTNGVVGTYTTLQQATLAALEHHRNHIEQGFNLSCDVNVYGVDADGQRVGCIH